MKTRKLVKRFIWLLAVIFFLMNIVSFFHAYKFTHFVDAGTTKTKRPDELSSLEKLKILMFGVNNPKPIAKIKPKRDYKTIKLQSNKEIECWQIKQNKQDTSKGTVIIFHGYNGDKSTMLDNAEEFLNLGYNTILVDFMGSGGSEGNQTTIGFKEAEEVKTVYDYITEQNEKNIYLFGTSMGAVAIMKALRDYKLNPRGIIIECPFGSMYQTTCNRFKKMNIPCFPMANMLVFWGGIQNGFWAFDHKPTEYAKAITCPTLLLYGEKDENVSREEIEEIYNNLQGKKTLKSYKHAGHENYLTNYRKEWIKDVSDFLNQNR